MKYLMTLALSFLLLLSSCRGTQEVYSDSDREKSTSEQGSSLIIPKDQGDASQEGRQPTLREVLMNLGQAFQNKNYLTIVKDETNSETISSLKQKFTPPLHDKKCQEKPRPNPCYLSSGGVGDTYIFEDMGKEYVIKTFKARNKLHEVIAKEVLPFFWLADHENIIRFYGLFRKDETSLWNLVLEKADGDLAHPSKEVFTKENQKRVIKGIIDGLEHMHSRGLVHSDLKENNIVYLLDGKGVLTPKLIDFGGVAFAHELNFPAATYTHYYSKMR